jgi:hypothetical protein
MLVLMMGRMRVSTTLAMGGVRRVLQGRGGIQVSNRDGRGAGAEKVDDHRLCGAARRDQHALGDRRRWWLRDEHDHPGGGIRRKRRYPLEHRHAADVGGEIPPSGADRLGDARTQPVDQAHHLLQPGARGGNAADGAAPDDVGEGQRYAIDDRRTAIGSHQETSALAREAFQGK